MKEKEANKINKKVHRGDEDFESIVAKLAEVALPAFVESSGSHIFSPESPSVVLGLLIDKIQDLDAKVVLPLSKWQFTY